MPDDPSLWSNLAITELLCGDFERARASAARSLELDPKDLRTNLLQRAVERWARSGRHPRTFSELNAAA